MKFNIWNNLLSLFSVAIAEIVPNLGIFISLIGALCSTALALVFPPVLELVGLWGSSEGIPWILVKNIGILVVALFGFGTGSFESIASIIKEFGKEFWLLPIKDLFCKYTYIIHIKYAQLSYNNII